MTRLTFTWVHWVLSGLCFIKQECQSYHSTLWEIYIPKALFKCHVLKKKVSWYHLPELITSYKLWQYTTLFDFLIMVIVKFVFRIELNVS
jgi:hypothetical protein